MRHIYRNTEQANPLDCCLQQIIAWFSLAKVLTSHDLPDECAIEVQLNHIINVYVCLKSRLYILKDFKKKMSELHGTDTLVQYSTGIHECIDFWFCVATQRGTLILTVAKGTLVLSI